MGAQRDWRPVRAPRDCIDLGDIVVRRLGVDDATRLHEAITASIEHLRPWMPWIRHEPADVGERVAVIEKWSDSWDDRTDFTMGVIRGEKVIGGTGLHLRSGPNVMEIGYWVHPAYVGQGVATRVVRGLVESAFLLDDVNVVQIVHDMANVASRRVAEKCGFQPGGETVREPQAPADTGRVLKWFTTRER